MSSDRPRARRSVKYTPQASAPSSPSDGELYYNNSTKKFQIYTGAAWTDLKTTDGLPNYISNPDAEANASGWNTYADAAASRPADGTGGTAAVTWSRTTTNPLAGAGSFQLVKDAVNRQGQGVSADFTIARRDRAKVLEISFDYEQVSGTYANGTSSTDSDLIIYLYDTTNARLIEPQAFKIDRCVASRSESFKTTFQSAADSTAYRLIIHVATTSASAYTINFDNFRVSQQTVVYSSPITDWQSYTPTYQGFGTVSTSNMRWRRNGDSVEIAGTFVTGTPTAVEARIGLPAGLQTDSSLSTTESCGVLARGAASTSNQLTLLAEPSVTYLTLGGVTAAAANPLTKVTGSGAAGSGETLSASHTRVKIRGWSSNTLSSNDADQRVLVARAMGNPTSSLTFPGYTTVTFAAGAESFDTHAALDPTTGIFTAPISGYYRAIGKVSISMPSAGATTFYELRLYKNNTTTEALRIGNLDANPGSTTNEDLLVDQLVQLNAGDTLRFQARSQTATAYATGDGYNYIVFERVQGPSSITATELIHAEARLNTGTLANSATTAVAFNTETFDTHDAYNTSTGVFTCPAAGRYLVNARIFLDGNTTGIRELFVQRNSGTVRGSARQTGSANGNAMEITAIVVCNAGDTLRIAAFQNSGGALGYSTDANNNNVSFIRLGV